MSGHGPYRMVETRRRRGWPSFGGDRPGGQPLGAAHSTWLVWSLRARSLESLVLTLDGRPPPCRCGGGHRAGHGSRSRVMPLGWLVFSPLRRLALLGWLVRSLARGWYDWGGRSAVARRGRAVRRVKIDQARVSWHGSCPMGARLAATGAAVAAILLGSWRAAGAHRRPAPAASERITLTSAACAPGAAIPRRLGRRRGALAAAVARPARRDPLASAAAPGSQRSGRDLRALAPSR